MAQFGSKHTLRPSGRLLLSAVIMYVNTDDLDFRKSLAAVLV
jgi:hypothetical protein